MCCETTTAKLVSPLLLTRQKFCKYKKVYSLSGKSITAESYSPKSSFKYQSIVKPFFIAIMWYFHAQLSLIFKRKKEKKKGFLDRFRQMSACKKI